MRDHRSCERPFDVDEETDLEDLAARIQACCQRSGLQKYVSGAVRTIASLVRAGEQKLDDEQAAPRKGVVALKIAAVHGDAVRERFRKNTLRKSGLQWVVSYWRGVFPNAHRFVTHPRVRCCLRRLCELDVQEARPKSGSCLTKLRRVHAADRLSSGRRRRGAGRGARAEGLGRGGHDGGSGRTGMGARLRWRGTALLSSGHQEQSNLLLVS